MAEKLKHAGEHDALGVLVRSPTLPPTLAKQHTTRHQAKYNAPQMWGWMPPDTLTRVVDGSVFQLC